MIYTCRRLLICAFDFESHTWILISHQFEHVRIHTTCNNRSNRHLATLSLRFCFVLFLFGASHSNRFGDDFHCWLLCAAFGHGNFGSLARLFVFVFLRYCAYAHLWAYEITYTLPSMVIVNGFEFHNKMRFYRKIWQTHTLTRSLVAFVYRIRTHLWDVQVDLNSNESKVYRVFAVANSKFDPTSNEITIDCLLCYSYSGSSRFPFTISSVSGKRMRTSYEFYLFTYFVFLSECATILCCVRLKTHWIGFRRVPEIVRTYVHSISAKINNAKR